MIDELITEEIEKKLLGCSVDDFVKNNLNNKIKIKDAKDFNEFKQYYSSDAYAAKLLSNFDYMFALTSKDKEFINILSLLSNYKRLNILCYGGQYGIAIALMKLGHYVTCVDFPHKVFKLFEEVYKNMSNFLVFEAIDKHLDGIVDIYDVVIAKDILNHDYAPSKLFEKLGCNMAQGKILYIPLDNSDNYEHVNNVSRSQFSGMISKCGFIFSLGNNFDILTKVSSLGGVKRFRYIDRHIVASIQREMFQQTINALCPPTISLNIGGPNGEFCKKSLSIDVIGNPDILARGEELPIKSNSIDLIYSSHSLEHMKNTRKTLREWTRVLKLNGLLTIIVPVLPFHRHSKKIKLGETCFEEHTIDEYKRIFDEIESIEILQFNVRKNDFDIDIIARKIK